MSVSGQAGSPRPTPGRVRVLCDGCRSWPVDENVTPKELVASWGWTEDWDEGQPLYFCPECS
jgi:hypothetical protein